MKVLAEGYIRIIPASDVLWDRLLVHSAPTPEAPVRVQIVEWSKGDEDGEAKAGRKAKRKKQRK